MVPLTCVGTQWVPPHIIHGPDTMHYTVSTNNGPALYTEEHALNCLHAECIHCVQNIVMYTKDMSIGTKVNLSCFVTDLRLCRWERITISQHSSLALCLSNTFATKLN